MDQNLTANTLGSKWVARARGTTGRWAMMIHLLWICLWQLMSGTTVFGQFSAIEFGGTVYGYSGQVYNSGGGVLDQYGPYLVDEGSGTLEDQSYNLIGSSYDYINGGGWNGAFAVAGDGYSFLGVPPCFTILDVADIASYMPPGQFNGYTVPPFALQSGQGYAAKYFQPTYIHTAFSPWYYYDGNASSDIVIDGRSGNWPASNVLPTPPPQYVYVNGRTFSLASSGYGNTVGGPVLTAGFLYENGNDGIELQWNLDVGSFTTSYIWGWVGSENFSSAMDPNTWQIQGIPDDLAITFSAPAGTPSFGPPMVSWNGYLLAFNYTTTDGKDLYWNAGDANGDYSVIIAGDGTALALHGGSSSHLLYDAGTKTFSARWDGVPANFFAQDAYGAPIGLPPGLTVIVSEADAGGNVLQADGSHPVDGVSYTFRLPDGAWGRKYLALHDGLLLVADENGNYTTPPYSYVAGTDSVIYTAAGWPATNIYPAQLYINGIPCTQVAGSQYDSGAGFPRNGGASYRAAAYDLTVVLSWNWDTSTGFQGFVTGKYGQSSSFRGSWDGLGNFSNMTNGAIASVTAPTTIPTDGNPPQIAVNGTALQYNSLASTALSNAGTPGDVYTGPLGQTLTIYQNGTTSFTPGAGGTAISGTYNAATHQFSFGTGGNSLTVTNSDGSSSNAVITATDTGGHNLATPIGGATNGDGVTELAGGLDVRGNTFTLGSWMTGNESVFGLGIAYGDAVSGSGSTAQLNLSTTRAAVNWNWIHPSADGGSGQVTAMQLDATHRVLLYDPGQAGSVGVVLDPNGANGNTGVSGTIRVWQRGDISMGQYVHGTQPPVPNGPGN